MTFPISLPLELVSTLDRLIQLKKNLQDFCLQEVSDFAQTESTEHIEKYKRYSEQLQNLKNLCETFQSFLLNPVPDVQGDAKNIFAKDKTFQNVTAKLTQLVDTQSSLVGESSQQVTVKDASNQLASALGATYIPLARDLGGTGSFLHFHAAVYRYYPLLFQKILDEGAELFPSQAVEPAIPTISSATGMPLEFWEDDDYIFGKMVLEGAGMEEGASASDGSTSAGLTNSAGSLDSVCARDPQHAPLVGGVPPVGGASTPDLNTSTDSLGLPAQSTKAGEKSGVELSEPTSAPDVPQASEAVTSCPTESSLFSPSNGAKGSLPPASAARSRGGSLATLPVSTSGSGVRKPSYPGVLLNDGGSGAGGSTPSHRTTPARVSTPREVVRGFTPVLGLPAL